MPAATSVHWRPPTTSVGVGPGLSDPSEPLPRTPNHETPQQYMSPVVMIPHVKPAVVVTAPYWVAPAAAIRVNQTTCIVGKEVVTAAPSMLAVIVSAVPMLAPT